MDKLHRVFLLIVSIGFILVSCSGQSDEETSKITQSEQPSLAMPEKDLEIRLEEDFEISWNLENGKFKNFRTPFH